MFENARGRLRAWRERLGRRAAPMLDATGAAAKTGAGRSWNGVVRARRPLAAIGLMGVAGYALYAHPPVAEVGRGEVALRTNRLTGTVDELRDTSAILIPGLHSVAVYSVRDHTYQPAAIRKAEGDAPLQSVEGLSFGVDLGVRYALDATRLSTLTKTLPEDVEGELVEPAVQGTIYKVFARYTVREIFSAKRVEIQQAIEAELKTKLAADGVLLKSVHLGNVDLPADYKRGMEGLLVEELASEKMRYTLELKDKRVKEIALDGEAEKVRSEKTAEAAARAQIIAAKGQEEAMKHVLPFKQRQVEQRKLEADAESAARVRGAEGNAQARRIEAAGEAEARQKLADAEVYRLDRIGRTNAEQMAREGDLITRHPLLVQKTLADKLSDKVQVIIAPPPASGGFIGETLLGAANVKSER